MLPHFFFVAVYLYVVLLAVALAISVVYALGVIIDRILELLDLPVLPAPPRAIATFPHGEPR